MYGFKSYISFENYQLYFHKAMLSTAFNSQMNYNRKLEKKFKHLNLQNIKDNKDYQCLSVGMLQYCELRGLKKQTKYLAKKNFDTYVLMFPHTSKERLYFVAISLLRLAVHFNEDPSIYDSYTIEFCVKQCENQFSAEQFKEFELGIFMREEFRLDFTTTYDYLGTYLKVFELTQRQIHWVRQVLDFSYSITRLTLCSAEEIFFATLVLLNKKSEQQTKWILKQTHYPSEVLNTYKILRQAVDSESA